MMANVCKLLCICNASIRKEDYSILAWRRTILWQLAQPTEIFPSVSQVILKKFQLKLIYCSETGFIPKVNCIWVHLNYESNLKPQFTVDQHSLFPHNHAAFLHVCPFGNRLTVNARNYWSNKAKRVCYISNTLLSLFCAPLSLKDTKTQA